MSVLLGNASKSLIWIVSAPAGAGKTTLVHMLSRDFPEISINISYTTRKPRLGEVHGKDYFFVSDSEFKNKIDNDDFLEYVNLYGAFYGTCKKWLQEQQDLGKHVILVIDVQGKLALEKKISCITIFIQPPSLQVLQKRLTERKTETLEKLNERIEWAEKELEAVETYDYQIINEELATAYRVLKSIVVAECHRTANYTRRVK